MKINILQKYFIVLIAAFILLASCTAEKAEQDAEKAEQDTTKQEFSCYTVDEQGEIIQGFFRESDYTWYLFVPSVEDISNIELYFTGNVENTSEGEINRNKISGAFSKSGDSVNLNLEEGQTVSVKVMQSELPSVQITINNATLDFVHEDKEVRSRLKTVRISDPNGKYDLTVNNSAEIKGRGNTTWWMYDKKSYQIRFDSKISVMGMNSAKKWILVSNAGDDSMIRNQLVYRMAKNLDMEFVPSFEYVDLWVNGEYLGTYLLGEKVEINSSRLNLTGNDAVLFEHDDNYFHTEEYWINNEILKRRFSLKEINVEDDKLITEAMEQFDGAVDELMRYLYTTPSADVTLEDLSGMIDVDSFAKYYLINEYVLNCESYSTSFFWYRDGSYDVLHAGPVWDFDTCMGNDNNPATASYGEKHFLFKYLLAAPQFYERTEELYEKYKEYLFAMTNDVQILKEKISASAEMNYSRWDVLGKANPKPHSKEFNSSFDGTVKMLEEWLYSREKYFEITECDVINSKISSDYRTIDVYFDDDKYHSSVLFALWNDEKKNSTVLWVAGEQINGVWQGTFDLTEFNLAGLYRIDAYFDDDPVIGAMGRNYVDVAMPPEFTISTSISEDGSTMSIAMEDTYDDCIEVWFAVWSEANNQADMIWVGGQKDSDGYWKSTVDMSSFNGEEVYHVHAYGYRDGTEYSFLNNNKIINPDFEPSISMSEDGTTMSIAMEDKYNVCKGVSFAVWSAVSNQADMVWVDATKDSDGFWKGTVDMSSFDARGIYIVHAYGVREGTEYAYLDGSEILIE